MEISAAILAGGRATRLGGADKASLVIGGRRILDRQLAVLMPITRDIRIVANDPAPYADLGIPVVADAVTGAGPLGGVYTALAGARQDAVLVLACDLPFVTPALVERLVAEYGRGEQVDAVVPRSRRGLEPLCAVYGKECAAAARRCLDDGERRMTAFLAGLRVRELDLERDGSLAAEDEGTLFENVNTPHDYARAQARVELDEKPFKDPITE